MIFDVEPRTRTSHTTRQLAVASVAFREVLSGAFVKTGPKKLRWTRKIVEQVMRLQELKKITRSKASLAVHATPKSCKRCRRRSQIVVMPDFLCGACWSKSVIRNWEPPQK